MAHVQVTRPRAQGYGAKIGGRWFRLANSPAQPLNIYTRDSLAERQDDTNNPDEAVLDLGYLFSRSNLTGGSGLDWWPPPAGEQATPRDATRFYDSANLRIRRPDPGEPYQITLSENFAVWLAIPGVAADYSHVASNARIWALDTGLDRVFYLRDYDQNVWAEVDNAPGSPQPVTAYSLNEPHLSVGANDTLLFIKDGDIHAIPGGAVEQAGFGGTVGWTTIYTAVGGNDIQTAWWVKGRVIALRVNTANLETYELIEIAPQFGGTPASPTSDPVVTLLDTVPGTVVKVVDAGHAIVAACTDGTLRSYVPQTDAAGGTPILTIRGQSQLPKHEIPYTMGYNQGVLMIQTLAEDQPYWRMRVYTASVLDERFDHVVGELQLIAEWDEHGRPEFPYTPNYQADIASDRDAMYLVGNDDSVDAISVFRYDLVTGGLVREHKLDSYSGTVQIGTHERNWGRGIVRFGGRTAVLTDSRLAVSTSVLVEGRDSLRKYHSESYLIFPNINFGLNAEINWTGFLIEAANFVDVGMQVEVFRSTNPAAITDPDHTDWVLAAVISSDEQSGVESIYQQYASASTSIMVKLWPVRGLNPTQNAPALNSNTPILRRVALRGLPEHRDWVAEVPVDISDIVRAPHRMPVRIPGHGDGEFNSLVSLRGSATRLEILDPPITLEGIIDAVGTPIAYQTPRGSQGTLSLLRLRGNRIDTVGSESAAETGVGIGSIGVATVGVDT